MKYVHCEIGPIPLSSPGLGPSIGSLKLIAPFIRPLTHRRVPRTMYHLVPDHLFFDHSRYIHHLHNGSRFMDSDTPAYIFPQPAQKVSQTLVLQQIIHPNQ